MADSDSTGKAPAFQFYPKDFLLDEHVRMMSLQERGLYITLICHCWPEGTLPVDLPRMSRVCGVPLATVRRLWPAMAECFRPAPGDSSRLIHPRLERERKKQRVFHRRQLENGKKGGRPLKNNPPENPRVSAVGNPLTKPWQSSNLISSHLISDSRQKDARESDALLERAGLFVRETYPALYAKHRKGARYVSRPALDFQEALELCRVWDDARLEKIATVFLTTDHEFAEKGSRTMAQFRSMASWCDSRLQEAGIA